MLEDLPGPGPRHAHQLDQEDGRQQRLEAVADGVDERQRVVAQLGREQQRQRDRGVPGAARERPHDVVEAAAVDQDRQQAADGQVVEPRVEGAVDVLGPDVEDDVQQRPVHPDQADDGGQDARQAFTTAQAQQEQGGPQQVELFLDAERPGVGEQRPVGRGQAPVIVAEVEEG